MTELLSRPHRKVEVYSCPNQCGWYRAYQGDAWWLRKPVDHPFYGLLREEELVRHDIADHDCGTYRDAHYRALVRREHERDHTQEYNDYGQRAG